MRGSVVIFRNEKWCVRIKVRETLIIFLYSLVLEASKLVQHYVHSRSAQDKLTVRHLFTVFILRACAALQPVHLTMNMFRTKPTN